MAKSDKTDWKLGDYAMTPWPDVEGVIVEINNDVAVLETVDGFLYDIGPVTLSTDGEIPPRPPLVPAILRGRDPFYYDTLYIKPSPNTGGIILSEQDGTIIDVADLEALLEQFRTFINEFGAENLRQYNKRRWLESCQPPLPRRRPKPPKAPKPGHIYILHGESGHHKIGRAKALDTRVSQLATQAPYKVKLLHSFSCVDMVTAEKALHVKFADKRVTGEWFDLSQEDVQWLCALTCWPVDQS